MFFSYIYWQKMFLIGERKYQISLSLDLHELNEIEMQVEVWPYKKQ